MTPGSAELTEAQFSGYRSLIPEVEGGLRSQARIETLPTLMLLSSDNPEHLAIFGWRISLPLIVPIMALFAIPLSRTDCVVVDMRGWVRHYSCFCFILLPCHKRERFPRTRIRHWFSLPCMHCSC